MFNLILFCILGYLSGSVLYSSLISRFILKIDLREVGDGNPGMTNVAKVGGVRWAVLAFILDCTKAAVPVGIAYYILGIQDWRILPIGLAPSIGHAYPIFFKFKGGKAIAAMGGAWVGIALAEVILVGATLLVYWNFSIVESAWVTVFMTLSTLIYLIMTDAPPMWIAFMTITIVFLTFTHRRSLSNPPGVKQWVKNVAALWH